MSKSTFKASLLATTVITGMALATPALAQNQTTPNTAPPAPVTPTDTQGNAPPAAPNSNLPPAGIQTNESAAPAQPTSAQEIVITGTLIRNPNLVASAPVTVIGHDEVQLRQTNTAEDILRTIPGAAPSIGPQVNNGSGGSAYVNLRGLGSNRNIVLIDGVRIVPVDLIGRVDLNDIPLALVDRVDVLTGGASSTYGADAVSGVVNFITRSDFAGMELAVSDQITQRGDGNYIRGDLTLGANFADGRGNAVISLGYQESDPVYQGGDRPWSNIALSSADPGLLNSATSATSVPTVIDIPGNSTACANPVNTSCQVDLTGGSIVPFYQGYNFNPYNVFQTPFKRYNLFSAAHYDITDHLTVYARGMYNNNTVDTIIAPSGIFSTNVVVPLSNPFLSAAQRTFLCNNADFDPVTAGRQTLTAAQCTAAAAATTTTDPNFRSVTIQANRRMPEVGPRISDYNTTMFDFRAGIRGDITDKIGFDLFGSRGISDKTQTIQNYVLTSRVLQSLWATNATTCLTTALPTGASSASGCVPLNIFGPEGSITPQMAAFISQQSTTRTRSVLSQGRGTINGDTPLQLWAKNPVSFAVGAEYRKYQASQHADTLAKTPGELGGAGGAVPDVPIVGKFAGFDVYEGFAEVIAPIVSDRPFFDELQLEAGIRRSHYSIGAPANSKFNTTTWKLAGSWAPVHDLKFRGAYNHAVRAPNIGELFTPVVGALVALSADPCAGAAPLSNANLAAICLAQGAPAGTIGSIPGPISGQVQQTTGGNPFLKPETAKTWTVGAVVRPRFIPGLTATIDYYNIKVTDAITLPTAGDVIALCFNNITAASASSLACTGIRRNPTTGGLSGNPATTPGLPRQLSNQGKLSTDGVDATFDYRHGLGVVMGTPAKIALNFGGNYTHSAKFQATPVSLNRECVGFFSVNCQSPNPKWSFNERTTLSLGRVDLSVLWRYIGALDYEGTASDFIARGFTNANHLLFNGVVNTRPSTSALFSAPGTFNGQTLNFNHIPAVSYFDFATRFNVNEHFDLTFTVRNLLDKKPPIIGNTAGTAAFNSGNTYPSTYDPLGRSFAAGARIKF
ncbi:MAG: TonB-dependent receptor domain-containing protein [Sphingomicrobium sp.]